MDWHAVPWVVFTDRHCSHRANRKGSFSSWVSSKNLYITLPSLGSSCGEEQSRRILQIHCGSGYGQNLGVQMAGVGADLIINEMAVVLQQNMTVKELSEVIHAHPTLSEVAKESAFALLGYPLTPCRPNL